LSLNKQKAKHVKSSTICYNQGMHEISSRFIEHSPELNQTLNQFVLNSIHRYSVGKENAQRMVEFLEDDLLESTTKEQLRILSSNQNATVDFVAPALRTVEDFQSQQIVRYQTPEYNAKWEQLEVQEVDTESRAITLIRTPSFMYRIQPNYPALLTMDMHHALTKPRPRGVHGAGRFALHLSFFDNESRLTDSGGVFEDVIRRTCRNYEILHPPKNETNSH
jgi:hypothetical protein